MVSADYTTHNRYNRTTEQLTHIIVFILSLDLINLVSEQGTMMRFQFIATNPFNNLLQNN